MKWNEMKYKARRTDDIGLLIICWGQQLFFTEKKIDKNVYLEKWWLFVEYCCEMKFPQKCFLCSSLSSSGAQCWVEYVFNDKR